MPITQSKIKLGKVLETISSLTKRQVLIGIPGETASRAGPINNAQLGYIHEFGSPARNIPARPFLHPGVERITDQAADILEKAVKSGHIERGFERVGVVAVSSVKGIIREKISPPLAESTLRGRLRVHKSRKAEKAELETGQQHTTPLIDTGQLINSITYVIR